MKYYVLGVFVLGFVLYGILMFYGVIGLFEFGEVYKVVGGNIDVVVLMFGVIFIVVGIVFKFGVVLFYMWVLDVY